MRKLRSLWSHLTAQPLDFYRRFSRDCKEPHLISIITNRFKILCRCYEILSSQCRPAVTSSLVQWRRPSYWVNILFTWSFYICSSKLTSRVRFRWITQDVVFQWWFQDLQLTCICVRRRKSRLLRLWRRKQSMKTNIFRSLKLWKSLIGNFSANSTHSRDSNITEAGTTIRKFSKNITLFHRLPSKYHTVVTRNSRNACILMNIDYWVQWRVFSRTLRARSTVHMTNEQIRSARCESTESAMWPFEDTSWPVARIRWIARWMLS